FELESPPGRRPPARSDDLVSPPSFRADPMVTPAASSHTADGQVIERSALEPAAAAPTTASASEAPGVLRKITANAAGRIFWLAGAALFFAQGAFPSATASHRRTAPSRRRWLRFRQYLRG